MLRIHRHTIEAIQLATAPEDLYQFVQSAIELEHSTIPPYLSAYYTLESGRNETIAEILRSVIVQEMLHMTIAGNLLLAIGGAPAIDRPAFIPGYPGPLPMNVGEDLIVGLEKFSKTVVKEVFMRIEEPEEPIEFPTAAFEAGRVEFATIGEFYAAIVAQLKQLGDTIFVGDRGRQVLDNDWFPEDQLFAITSVESAAAAIDIIVRQGEGTPQSPLDPEGEFAHYYRFAEIFHGRRLVPDQSSHKGYSYTGSEVAFDADGVWDMAPNPKVAHYPEGSRARRRAEQFAFSYTKLLTALHAAFNSDPARLRAALGLMYELRLMALDVLSTTDSSTGRPTGLCFEFAPLNR